MSEQKIARIVHFNFQQAQDCELFYLKLEKEPELAKESLQRTIIKVDEKSLILFTIYKNKEDLQAVGNRINPWLVHFKADNQMETIPITGDVVLNELKYGDDE
jgi:hypothetical protein